MTEPGQGALCELLVEFPEAASAFLSGHRSARAGATWRFNQTYVRAFRARARQPRWCFHWWLHLTLEYTARNLHFELKPAPQFTMQLDHLQSQRCRSAHTTHTHTRPMFSQSQACLGLGHENSGKVRIAAASRHLYVDKNVM